MASGLTLALVDVCVNRIGKVHRFLGTDHLRRIHVIHDGLCPDL
jgi:hypothetical protein